MWARTYVHFTNGGEHGFVLLRPAVPGRWLLSHESTKGESSRIRCLLCSKHGDRLKASSTSFLQGVRELQWRPKETLVKNCKAVAHKRPFLVSSSRREPSTKILRGARFDAAQDSDNVCFVVGGWESRVNWSLDLDLAHAHMMLGHLKNFLSSWSWRGGMASALVKRTTSCTNNIKTSRTREDPRNTKRQLNASLVVCTRVSICCTNEQIFHATGWHSFIILLLKSVCGSDHFAAEKKNCWSISRLAFAQLLLGKSC